MGDHIRRGRQVEEHTDQIGLKKNAIDRAKRRNGVYELET